MSFLGGIMKSVINPATLLQVAMGPAGWANLALQTVGRSLLNEVIGQVGARLGLPPAMVSLAQQSFAGAGGVPASLDQAINTLGQRVGASMTEIGAAQREGRTVMQQMVESTLSKARGDDEVAAGGGGQSRLMKIAIAMGKLLDKKMDQMIDVSSAMDKVGKTPGDTVSIKESGITGIDFGGKTEVGQGTLSGMMQALSQELGQISNALSTTLKSLGESNSTLARKS